jgi:hypothetical protein
MYTVKNTVLKEFLEANDFSVNVFEQDGVEVAELETWTEGGVNMIPFLSPFTMAEFVSYVEDFDIDEQVDLHRQDNMYRKAFNITESVEDFTDFHNRLKEVCIKFNKMFDYLDDSKYLILSGEGGHDTEHQFIMECTDLEDATINLNNLKEGTYENTTLYIYKAVQLCEK